MKRFFLRWFAAVVIVFGLIVLLAAGLSAVAATHGVTAAAGLLLFALSLGRSRIAVPLGAATTDFNAPERSGRILTIPVAADTRLFAGTLAAADADGNAVPAADAAGLRVLGRTEEQVDNSGGAAGAVFAQVKRGVFRYGNSATNPITQADFGNLAFVEDDATVAKSTTHKVIAGRVMGVESLGVWIDTRPAVIAAALVASSADGGAAGAADLDALKAEIEKIGDDARAVIAAVSS
jgi:hypothetical protein